MDQLKSPSNFTSFSPQGDNGICPFVVAGTQAAVIVRAGAAGGDEDEVTLWINRHDGPGVGRSAAPCFGGSTSGGIRRNWIPTPAQRARARVKCAHHTGGHVHATVIVNG